MATSNDFSGFPEQGLQFMSDLAIHNDREWFNDNKQVYLDNIVQPAVAFVEALGERLQYISPHIQYDTRTDGQGSLMRIYRDTRFSKDKSPYKTWVGIRFWEGGPKPGQNPGYYFGFDGISGGIHVGMHGFDNDMLTAYRAAVDNETTGKELEEALANIRQSGEYGIRGEYYKRVPRGYDPGHPRAGLLRFNTLYASSPAIEPVVLASPELVEVVMDHCEKLAPIQQWLVKVKLAAAI